MSTGSQDSATGFFGVLEESGRWWMTRPDGTRSWSFGVDCVAPGTPWNTFDPGNPSYCAWKLFPDPGSWVRSTLERLRSWGFDTIGGWADLDLLRRHGGASSLPYTIVLLLGQAVNAPFEDLFDQRIVSALEEAARSEILPLVDDPGLIGYFSDNELGWWDDTLFLHYLGMAPSRPGKKQLMRLIRDHYRADWDALQMDWLTPAAKGFDELADSPTLWVRPGGRAMALIDAWTFTLADRYYGMVERAIRKVDPNRLLLGDRLIQYYSLPVARACARHVDVVSTNLGADWNDGTLCRFFLDTLHQETRKPILITEFYMAATENRSGNRNTGTAFPVVDTQAERAVSFDKNVRAMASLPYVVGAHWFQFHDEPMHGREDGEDFNMGLVDIHGEVYEGMAAAAAGLDVVALHGRSTLQPDWRSTFVVPHAFERPFDPCLRDWPRPEGFVPPSSERGAFADLYVCRDAEHLYLGLYAMDYADERVYEGGRMPASERAEWTVGWDGLTDPIVVRFMGKGQPAESSDTRYSVVEADGIKWTLVLRIPLIAISANAQRLRLFSSLSSHSDAERMSWDARLDLEGRSVRPSPNSNGRTG